MSGQESDAALLALLALVEEEEKKKENGANAIAREVSCYFPAEMRVFTIRRRSLG